MGDLPRRPPIKRKWDEAGEIKPYPPRTDYKKLSEIDIDQDPVDDPELITHRPGRLERITLFVRTRWKPLATDLYNLLLNKTTLPPWLKKLIEWIKRLW